MKEIKGVFLTWDEAIEGLRTTLDDNSIAISHNPKTGYYSAYSPANDVSLDMGQVDARLAEYLGYDVADLPEAQDVFVGFANHSGIILTGPEGREPKAQKEPESEENRLFAAVIVPHETILDVNRYLSNEEHLGGDNTISVTATFPGGFEMDVKCCGCRDEDDEAWTEAVLFKDGSEVCCSEVCEEFTGLWELEADGVNYVANIIDEADIRFYEVDLTPEYSICIRAIAEPTKEGLNKFLAADLARYDSKEVLAWYPIIETEARAFYDFDKYEDWPVYGADPDGCEDAE